jgi:hypothetical protein
VLIDREKVETFLVSASWHELILRVRSIKMIDTARLRTAVDSAWSIFCATHDGVDASDSRRCLLERHLKGRCEARGEEVDELASFGLAYLARLADDGC